MLKVTRGATPLSLAGPRSKGGIERRKAIAYFARSSSIPNRKRSKYKLVFSAYKSPDVSRAVQAAFFGKCAYCESRYLAMHPVEIEHYRPKSAVTYDRTAFTRGYYWLAASWDNLLPTCIDCNRERWKHVIENGTTRTAKCGKGTHFPLVNRRRSPPSPKSMGREVPLLLNPTIDNPLSYLTFHRNGEISPKPRLRKLSRQRAEATIRTLGLYREGLVIERKAKATRVIASIARIVRFGARRKINRASQHEIKEEIMLLKEECAPRSPYAGLARQLVLESLGLRMYDVVHNTFR